MTLTKFERRVAPIARRWHGIIPTWELRNAGIDGGQFRRWAESNDDVLRDYRGVYTWKEAPQADWEYTNLARELAKAGPGAALWGPTVLALLHLGTWASQTIYIAAYGRRKSSRRIVYMHDNGFARIRLHGMAAQNVRDALLCSKAFLDEDKWGECAQDAVERGLVSKEEIGL
ncbi:MAG: hypothetical protein LKI26_00825 [Bifidobacterium tibiigranuli]|uniref:hypothetical protein n=1 Tax=Bifidobacterium tibiigranuli TaxID=2172043 RepID=UPI0026F17801|nr:hypothetical protein [Bifidobacterium tibiigranuli]MCI1649177.1 hypothetical protein [Bifidobacterium tibiigranuli]MCI2185595.1 hypothetical protein [Bifidobacterium tibiigranuli]